MEYELQTEFLKQRVWVHASDGSTVGRFDVRSGMDIHTSATEQLAGAPQCFHCTHGKQSFRDWIYFIQYAAKEWNFCIPSDAINIPFNGSRAVKRTCKMIGGYND